MRVVWSRVAIGDLRAARAHIAKDDPTAAAKFAQRLVEATDLLAEFPGAGRAGRAPHTRELVASGTPYIVPYRVSAGVVQIIAVIHTSRRWPDR